MTGFRKALLVGFALLALKHLFDPDFWSPFAGLVFGTHEFGHLAFAFFGEWLAVAGGSLMQLLLPAAMMVYFHRVRGDRLGVAVCGVWLAISLANLAVYIGDARAQQLDLVSFSPGGAIHDWNYLLGSLGLLSRDGALAGLVRLVGLITLAASVVGAARAPRGSKTVRKRS